MIREGWLANWLESRSCRSINSTAFTEVGKWLVIPIKHQLNYLCCFNTNIQTLNHEAEKLRGAAAELQAKVDDATNNARDIRSSVQTWLADAKRIQAEKGGIDSNIQNVQKGCLAVPSRFSLSRKAKKTAEAMKELCISCNQFGDSNDVSIPRVHTAATQPVLWERPDDQFESRKKIEENVMKSLRCEKVNRLGICGMGGIGKTTMAKNLMDRVKQEKLFDETVLAVVSKPIDLLRIQKEIAEQLGFEKLKNFDTLLARANELYVRLSGTKRILIVLDDVWETFNLEELGIPSAKDSKGCTVLFTSRVKDELTKMNAKVFELKDLSEDEAWRLFKEKAGDCVNDRNLTTIAKKVAKECQGLPISLVTIGAALKDQEKLVWEDALVQLENSNSSSQLKDKVYDRLRLSYNYLEKREEKSLFLLCSVFPEDFTIHHEDLTLYSVGLNMLEGVDTLEQARNRVYTTVKGLKSRFLVMDGDNEHEVKMHDDIRDVAISIAKEGGLLSKGKHDGNCQWVSHFTTSKNESFHHLGRPNFSSPCLLIIQRQGSSWAPKLEINDVSFLEGMPSLNILSLKCISAKSLERAIQFVKNLRILRLDFSNFKSLSSVGGLLKLEVLNCRWCDKIKEVPEEIGGLTCLKLLDLSHCRNLRKIAAGVISKLVELEELKITNSFSEWESSKVCEENRRNASLMELESLHKLTWLEIEIKDESLAEEEIRLSPTLVNYKIYINNQDYRLYEFSVRMKTMALHRLSRDSKFGSWIQKLVNTGDDLILEGNGWRNLDLSQAYEMVRKLKITKHEMVEKLGNAQTNVFSGLETLILRDLPNLMQIWDDSIVERPMFLSNLQRLDLEGLPSLTNLLQTSNHHVSFNNLKDLDIYKCNKLENVMVLGTGDMEVFLKLERVEIIDCEVMKQVFIENGMRQHLRFPELKEISLWGLTGLTSFSKGIESIEFPLLEGLIVRSCPELKGFVSPMEPSPNKSSYLFHDQKLQTSGDVQSSSKNEDNREDDHIHDNESLHLFCNNKVKFGELMKDLTIGGYDHLSNIWCQKTPPCFLATLKALNILDLRGITTLFSSSMVQDLGNLKSLSIKRCEHMEQVVVTDKVTANEISIDKHQKNKEASTSKGLGGKTKPVVFPKLETLILEDLSSLTTFASGIESVEFPMLEDLRIKSCPKLVISIASTMESNDKKRVDKKNPSKQNPLLFCISKVKFGMLKRFEVSRCNNSSNILQDILHHFSETLEVCRVGDCNNISTLFSSSTVRYLVNLKVLSIGACENMKQVIGVDHQDMDKISEKTEKLTVEEDNEDPGTTSHVTFPKLQNLELRDLPSLTNFGKGIGIVEFPVLHELNISSCPQLNGIVSPIESNTNFEDKGCVECSTLFDNEKVKFGALRELRITKCHNVRNLLSDSMVDNLASLQSLEIKECNNMEKVIADEKEKPVNSLVFPSLRLLWLKDLPLLRMFCGWKCPLELPLLRQIITKRCPRMELLTRGSLTTPKLNDLYVGGEWLKVKDVIKMGHDLNGFLCQHIMSTKEEEEKEKMGGD